MAQGNSAGIRYAVVGGAVRTTLFEYVTGRSLLLVAVLPRIINDLFSLLTFLSLCGQKSIYKHLTKSISPNKKFAKNTDVPDLSTSLHYRLPFIVPSFAVTTYSPLLDNFAYNGEVRLQLRSCTLYIIIRLQIPLEPTHDDLRITINGQRRPTPPPQLPARHHPSRPRHHQRHLAQGRAVRARLPRLARVQTPRPPLVRPG